MFSQAGRCPCWDELNALGYLVFFAVAGGAFALWGKRWRPGGMGGGFKPGRLVLSRYARRFRRVLPMLFLLAAVGAFLGGAFYAPNNYDALTYRLPRVLMWWDHQSWYWISTPNPPMNYSGAGFEWLIMPLLVLTHSDRLLFLINLSGFLLMPGLLFSVSARRGRGGARRLDVDVAAAFGVLLYHAGGQHRHRHVAANCALSAAHFAFRARRTGRAEDLGLASGGGLGDGS